MQKKAASWLVPGARLVVAQSKNDKETNRGPRNRNKNFNCHSTNEEFYN